MGLLDFLNRLGLFLDRSNYGIRVGNFRTNSLFENTILTQNAREQAIRFEKQFDTNRGKVTDFEAQFRPNLEAEFVTPFTQQIDESQKFIDSIIARAPNLRLDRTTGDIMAGKINVPFRQLNRNQQIILSEARLREQTIPPLSEFITKLSGIRTQNIIGINEIFKTIAPNSSL